MERFMGYTGGNLTIVDKVLPDMLPFVDAHWYQFPPINPLWQSIIAFVVFMVGSIAMIGNYFVLNIFMTTKALRTPSNLFVINLAFSDFLMYFTNGPGMSNDILFHCKKINFLITIYFLIHLTTQNNPNIYLPSYDIG